MKVLFDKPPAAIWGSNLVPLIEALPQTLLSKIRTGSAFGNIRHTSGPRKLRKAVPYLESGYEIMQCRLVTNSNMESEWVAPYVPLMERSVAAWSFHQAPYKLEMQRFQRSQVSKAYPALKGVRTDRGLTCDVDRCFVEQIQSYTFLFKVALGRILHRGGSSSAAPNKALADILSSPGYEKALDVCRRLGILVPEGEIPTRLADKLFTVGTLFANSQGK